MIPQTCWYNSNKFDCGLSISCVLEGGKPVDLCSGGMIWSCCVSRDKIQTSGSSSSSSSSAVTAASNSVGTIENASEFLYFTMLFLFSFFNVSFQNVRLLKNYQNKRFKIIIIIMVALHNIHL